MMEVEEEIMCHSCHTTDKDLLNFQTDFYGMFVDVYVALHYHPARHTFFQSKSSDTCSFVDASQP